MMRSRIGSDNAENVVIFMLVYIHAGSYHRQGGKILTQVRDAFSSFAYILTLMRKLLVFQHSAREPLGVLDPMLRQAGFRVRYVNFSRDPGAQLDVRRYNGLIVLGGQMNVDQADQYPHLTTEISASRRRCGSRSRFSASVSACSYWPQRSAPTCGLTMCAKSAGIACIRRPPRNRIDYAAQTSSCKRPYGELEPALVRPSSTVNPAARNHS